MISTTMRMTISYGTMTVADLHETAAKPRIHLNIRHLQQYIIFSLS